MKILKISLGIGFVAALSLFLTSADHIDAPAVTNMPTDITDYYAFSSPADDSKMVFVANLSGLLSPSMTGTVNFDENVLVEFNIDNTGDNVEDLVIQAIPRHGKMYIFGPYAPSAPGKASNINADEENLSVDITSYGQSAVSASRAGITAFAGPRDDPFFFDLGAYMDVLAGNASGFSDPGNDTFAGTNVMSIVVEVPKSLLGNSASLSTWVESKIKS